MVARLLMWWDLEPPSFERGSGKKIAKTDHSTTAAAASAHKLAVGMLMVTMLVVVEAGTAGATFPGHNGKLKE
jgi:hypothetical protein